MPDLAEQLHQWIQGAPDAIKAMFNSQIASSDAQGDTQTKAEANYRPSDTPDESCSTCTHFDGEASCEIVSGRISPDHVSDNYSPQESARQSGTDSGDSVGGGDSGGDHGTGQSE